MVATGAIIAADILDLRETVNVKADYLERGLSRAGRTAWRLVLGAALLAGSVAAGQEVKPEQYLTEDALLTGRVMHSFAADGQTVNVVVGDFALTLGQRRISGRDAVMWVRERALGQQVLRDIELYVEGQAKVVEPDGTTTTDQMILVALRQKGLLRAQVDHFGDEPLDLLPVYQRAVQERRLAATREPVKPPPAVLVRRPPGKAAQTQPASQPTTAQAPVEAYNEIVFEAEDASIQEVADPRDPTRKVRLTVARGNLYLSESTPQPGRFLEMRAQCGVVYSLPQGGPGGREQVLGVYLEGDVVMRRGERTVTGNSLFYDFQTGKAIVLEPIFRTVQERREVPVYVRAKEARQLAARAGKPGQAGEGRQWLFSDATLTTSDFYTPFYSIRARSVYLEDLTPYDDTGRPLTPMNYRSKIVNSTFNLGAVPMLWWPYTLAEGEQGHTALRRLTINHHGDFGWGVASNWYLFRLLGVPNPPGARGRLDADVWQHGFLIGPNVTYRRENYAGLLEGTYVRDDRGSDTFGTQRKDINAPTNRGQVLARHKQFLEDGWEYQAELAYLSDRNFLEQYYPGDFWTEKDRETLLYAKKQIDNWAFTALGQWRLNDFQTQTEAYPDLAAYLVGQSLWDDRLVWYAEGHAGVLRYRPDTESILKGSPSTGRLDTRQEIDAPVAIGPFKLLPFTAGRLSYWSATPDAGQDGRAWGQVGFNATTNIWRIYDQVESRLWDVYKLKHVITPYGGLFFSGSNLRPEELYPFSPDIEQYLRRELGGGQLGVRQVWQTKRGTPEERQIVDWLRLDVAAMLFTDHDKLLPADGRYFWSRPEYSLARDSINADLSWFISNATTLLADLNYDIRSGGVGGADIGLAVARNPRLRYYVGNRYIRDLDSNVGTYAIYYEISKKYSLDFLEQYDYKLEGGKNQITSISLTRRLPRLNVSFIFTYDRARDDVGVALSIWPEGVPEAGFNTGRMNLANAFGPSKE